MDFVIYVDGQGEPYAFKKVHHLIGRWMCGKMILFGFMIVEIGGGMTKEEVQTSSTPI